MHVSCGEFEGATNPAWIRGTIETPWLDVSASIDAVGMVSLVVVNIHEERGFVTRIEGLKLGNGKEVEVFVVGGESVNVSNMKGEESSVLVKESKWDGNGVYEFPKASMTMLRWKA